MSILVSIGLGLCFFFYDNLNNRGKVYFKIKKNSMYVNVSSVAKERPTHRTPSIYLLTSDEHHAYGERFLRVGIGRYVSKPHGSQRAECEVQRCNVPRLEKNPKYNIINRSTGVVPG